MRILMVGPGVMPIPPKGWGGVENVIWCQKIHLEKLGHKVDILNRRGFIFALLAKTWSYDIVHLHYDVLAGFWVKLSKLFGFPLIVTTHYGYAAYPKFWKNDGFEKVFEDLEQADGLLLLSQETANVFRRKGYKGWIGIQPNGTEVSEFRFQKQGNGKAIYLGKIEIRKKQALLVKLMNQHQKVDCDFVGPKVDNEFSVNNINTHYLGPWDRSEVTTQLTNYSCLVLVSDGEGHAAVVCEALAAGLSLVISKESSAHLDTSKDFIDVVEEITEGTINVISEACKKNIKFRNEIRLYAENNFDWNIVLNKYIANISEALESIKEKKK